MGGLRLVHSTVGDIYCKVLSRRMFEKPDQIFNPAISGFNQGKEFELSESVLKSCHVMFLLLLLFTSIIFNLF